MVVKLHNDTLVVIFRELTLPLAITIRYGVVAREEAYLERRFGDAYRDDKARVRRWLRRSDKSAGPAAPAPRVRRPM